MAISKATLECREGLWHIVAYDLVNIENLVELDYFKTSLGCSGFRIEGTTSNPGENGEVETTDDSQEGDANPTAKYIYEILRGKAPSGYEWQLKSLSGNKRIAKSAKSYKTKKECFDIIDLIQHLAPTAETDDLTDEACPRNSGARFEIWYNYDKNECCWRLHDADNNEIARSGECYMDKALCKQGIESIKQSASQTVEIVDAYLASTKKQYVKPKKK